MPNYGDPKYWDKRYLDNEGTIFDWLEDYSSLKPLFEDLIPHKRVRILVIGCGNAPMSEDMYDEGYELIHNIDISSVVIKQMRERNQFREKMTYEVMDCTDMNSIPDNFYDVAIDKSTIDALLCGDNAYLNVAKMTREI
jgi:EEF1A lysine methyltransferase 4